MTPSALTPAARGTTKRSKTDGSSRPSTSRSSGHRTGLRREVAPRAPRRVSGPSGGAATIARPAVAPRTAPSRPAPSRTAPGRTKAPRSAPTRKRTLRSRVRPAVKAPWRVRSTAYIRALPDHALLDRIIRGRAWIPILGVLLVGIVAMQVEVLKLNAGIGRSLERASSLQSQNELLRAGVARLSDEQRIERIAAGMGMVMPAPDQMRFVRGGASSVEAALNSIKAPNTTSFLAALPTIGAPAAAQGTSTNTAVGTAAVTATGTAATTATPAAGTTGATATGTVATAATGVAATPSTSATSTGASTSGTSASSTPASTAAGTSATAPVTSAAAPTGQSSPSSTGGATPIGG